MSTAGLIAGVILSLLTLALIALPFFTRGDNQQEIEALKAAYEQVLTTIRELDEDYELGKIQEGFYKAERAKFMAQGVELLKQLDAVQPDMNQQPDIDSTIEAAIATKRKKQLS